MKKLYLVCAALCLIGVFNVGSSYYDMLRILITIGAVVVFLNEEKRDFSFWIVSSALIGFLFNPIFPIYLYDKGLWIIIDIFVAGWFMVKANSEL